jgi:hypothetical protein
MAARGEDRGFALGLLQPARTSTIDASSIGSNLRSARRRWAGLKLTGARRPGVYVRLESFMLDGPAEAGRTSLRRPGGKPATSR